MSFIRIIYIILMIIAGYSVYYLYSGQGDELAQVSPSSEFPTLSGQNVDNVTYNESGVRSYRVVSKQLEHYAKSGNTIFEVPALSVYRNGKTEEWRITADRGVLDKDQILTLYGNVLAQNLLPDASFDTMATDKLLINLTDRNFWADSQVLLTGPDFETEGQKMKGNFGENTATLYEKVQGRYETLTP
jgi:lipopolysaccharide export system protein LptC